MDNKFQCDILSKVKEINEFAAQLEKRKAYLSSKLSSVDKEIIDIQHAAEFYNLNAAQGYKIYALLHDACVRRRSYKDELNKIDLTLNRKINKDSLATLEEVLTAEDNREYKPRVLKDLFASLK